MHGYESRERERDVDINISLIFPREKIPGKTWLERARRRRCFLRWTKMADEKERKEKKKEEGEEKEGRTGREKREYYPVRWIGERRNFSSGRRRLVEPVVVN